MTFGRVLCAILGLGLATLQLASAEGAVAPQASGQPATDAYEDRLIDGGTLSQLRQEGEDTVYDPDGIPRYWRVEAVTSSISQGGTKTHENGFRLAGRVDTPDYGALTLEGTVRLQPGSTIFTLTQRALPFDMFPRPRYAAPPRNGCTAATCSFRQASANRAFSMAYDFPDLNRCMGASLLRARSGTMVPIGMQAFSLRTLETST
jgi:hypothetical protein